MSELKYWWAAIWPDGTITRGHCSGLTQAIKKTERCVACSIQTNIESVTGAIPTLKARYENWGAESWQTTDTSSMRYSQTKKGFHRKTSKPKRKHVK